MTGDFANSVRPFSGLGTDQAGRLPRPDAAGEGPDGQVAVTAAVERAAVPSRLAPGAPAAR